MDDNFPPSLVKHAYQFLDFKFPSHVSIKVIFKNTSSKMVAEFYSFDSEFCHSDHSQVGEAGSLYPCTG